MGIPEKNMTKFGPAWENWDRTLAEFWDRNVGTNDIVLLGGDILWPTSTHDCTWNYLSNRPGKLYFIDGNHDKFVRQGIDKHRGAVGYNNYMKDKYGASYLGGTGLVRVGNTAILSQKLCDLPSHTFYPHFEQGVFANELHHLNNLIDQYGEEFKSCKNRIFMSHFNPMDNSLNYGGSEWIKTVAPINPTHWLYGHYHGDEVWSFLPSCDTEWNGIRFMNTSFDLYGFKMRCVLESVE